MQRELRPHRSAAARSDVSDVNDRPTRGIYPHVHLSLSRNILTPDSEVLHCHNNLPDQEGGGGEERQEGRLDR